MMIFLNRMRGGGVPYGSVIASLFVGLLFGFITDSYIIGITMAIGYNLGERMGWGEWVGNLTGIKNNTLSYESEEGRTNGIYWIVSKFFDASSDWVRFCRVALALRGVYWAILALSPLYFVINPFVVTACILWLGVAFPLACELGKRTFENGYTFKFLDFQSAWNLQEGWYGLAWDIAFIILIIGV